MILKRNLIAYWLLSPHHFFMRGLDCESLIFERHFLESLDAFLESG
jgi:hypothetical protein